MQDLQAARGRVETARAEGKPWVSASTLLSAGNNGAILDASPVTQPQALMSVPAERGC